MKQSNWHRGLPLVVMLAAIGLSGCQRTARDLSLDQPTARGACETALTAWKDGRMPADLKPDIIVGDYQWTAGKKLTDFEIQPDKEFNDGTNLHIHVRLTLQDENGKESNSDALYVVGTDPVVTVIRD